MRLYLRHIADNAFSDAADYPEIPFPAPEGCEWVEGIPDDLEVYRPRTLAEALEDIFLQALQEYGDAISPDVEGDLFMLKAGIADMLKFNRLAAAKAKIENASIPEALEPIRTAMLEKFPS